MGLNGKLMWKWCVNWCEHDGRTDVKIWVWMVWKWESDLTMDLEWRGLNIGYSIALLDLPSSPAPHWRMTSGWPSIEVTNIKQLGFVVYDSSWRVNTNYHTLTCYITCWKSGAHFVIPWFLVYLGGSFHPVSTLKDEALVVGCFTQWCMFILLRDAVSDGDGDAVKYNVYCHHHHPRLLWKYFCNIHDMFFTVISG